ncbi:MAG: hypothetical protein J6K45_04955 [Clostridia bacterium]|nr:hypothetical protein [Clostridia bacterium]
MPSKEEIEKARDILLRGNDIESAAIILEAVIMDNIIITGNRVNILRIATRQILNFLNEYKDKDYLEVVREKVKANEKNRQLEAERKEVVAYIQRMIVMIEEAIKQLSNTTYYYERQEMKAKLEVYKDILDLMKGE